MYKTITQTNILALTTLLTVGCGDKYRSIDSDYEQNPKEGNVPLDDPVAAPGSHGPTDSPQPEGSPEHHHLEKIVDCTIQFSLALGLGPQEFYTVWALPGYATRHTGELYSEVVCWGKGSTVFEYALPHNETPRKTGRELDLRDPLTSEIITAEPHSATPSPHPFPYEDVCVDPTTLDEASRVGRGMYAVVGNCTLPQTDPDTLMVLEYQERSVVLRYTGSYDRCFKDLCQ